ncbi:IclR family transcriptional regulator [Marinobacter pelagius]|uniref:IclR family transcriptional regulator n=1 Tax=Marinobacter pelagius TaxID=379482 RepID=A0A366GV48_9GAMM|nr:IclR family transcriptional regulator [Marinobacter pelagius]RBP31833.1 IclR family transcriptional regulator [Marinobacter pelagius]
MMSEQDQNPEPRHGGIQVIARAAAIMRVLGTHPDGLSLGELARELSLPRSTVQRIIAALETEGFAEHARSGYRLGPELGRLLYHTQVDVISVARPLLDELSQSLDETVVFCTAERERVLVIDRVVAERELRVVPPMGTIRVPFHSTAPGKALMANMDDQRVGALLDLAEAETSEKTVDRQGLLREIQTVRRTGVAEEMEEYREGITAFAVALETYLGHFAVAVVVPTFRARHHRKEYVQPLKDFKSRLEAKLGA